MQVQEGASVEQKSISEEESHGEEQNSQKTCFP